MFVLRKISGSGVEMNIALGDGYTLTDKEANKKEFEDLDKHYKFDDCIYAVVIARDGSEVLPLSSKQKSFIMTGSGQTFSNVSLMNKK